ncbi:MAG: hypothetical protein M0R41_00655 [Methylobacter tundripaludum]|nr:hypothetical protein [Methylobacter tundripaludum]
MSNLNVSNAATASTVTSASNTAMNGQQKVTTDFQSTLEKAMQAENTAKTSSDLKMRMKDGKVVELKNYRRLNFEPVTVESVQKKLGLSQEEAEAEFARMAAEHKKLWAEHDKLEKEHAKAAEEASSPEGQKKYLMSKEVEAVARDATGNIVAKLYKDGSFFCSNRLAGVVSEFLDGRSHAQAMQKIAKQPNVVVTHYKSKVTDFDLLPEQIANDRKQYLLYPEFYREHRASIEEVMALRERILAL